MRPRRPSPLWLAVAAAIGAAPAPAAPAPAAADLDVCIAVSGHELREVADAARRALGQPARRRDVRDARDRAALASSCGRLVIAVGPEALRAAHESAPRSPVVHVMAGSARSDGAPGVVSEADPRRVLDTLRTLVPKAQRVGTVFNPDLTGALVADAQAAARALGMELVALPARTVGEAVRAYHRFETELPVDALWLLPDATATVQETVLRARARALAAHRGDRALAGTWRAARCSRSCRAGERRAAAGELGQQVLRGRRLRGPSGRASTSSTSASAPPRGSGCGCRASLERRPGAAVIAREPALAARRLMFAATAGVAVLLTVYYQRRSHALLSRESDERLATMARHVAAASVLGAIAHSEELLAGRSTRRCRSPTSRRWRSTTRRAARRGARATRRTLLVWRVEAGECRPCPSGTGGCDGSRR
jgi:hypothetical protein